MSAINSYEAATEVCHTVVPSLHCCSDFFFRSLASIPRSTFIVLLFLLKTNLKFSQLSPDPPHMTSSSPRASFCKPSNPIHLPSCLLLTGNSSPHMCCFTSSRPSHLPTSFTRPKLFDNKPFK